MPLERPDEDLTLTQRTFLERLEQAYEYVEDALKEDTEFDPTYAIAVKKGESSLSMKDIQDTIMLSEKDMDLMMEQGNVTKDANDRGIKALNALKHKENDLIPELNEYLSPYDGKVEDAITEFEDFLEESIMLLQNPRIQNTVYSKMQDAQNYEELDEMIDQYTEELFDITGDDEKESVWSPDIGSALLSQFREEYEQILAMDVEVTDQSTHDQQHVSNQQVQEKTSTSAYTERNGTPQPYIEWKSVEIDVSSEEKDVYEGIIHYNVEHEKDIDADLLRDIILAGNGQSEALSDALKSNEQVKKIRKHGPELVENGPGSRKERNRLLITSTYIKKQGYTEPDEEYQR